MSEIDTVKALLKVQQAQLDVVMATVSALMPALEQAGKGMEELAKLVPIYEDFKKRIEALESRAVVQGCFA